DDKGEYLPGATVHIDGTYRGVLSDLDGNFIIDNVNIGDVTLVCSFISYETAKKTVKVEPGKVVQLDFVLSEVAISLDEISITARANRETENILLLERKEAVVPRQTIGAQELSRKGVGDAEGAVTKVSGVSKQEGIKNVFVRGLGDRYNLTTLNGFAVPSEDPEYKNISLEFFTDDIIKSVEVSKVFSASLSGDVGGALIDIKSKELVNDREFEVKVSSSINSQSAGIDFFLPDGVNRFGYSEASYGPYNNTTDYSFTTSLDPIEKSAPYNSAVSFSWGKRFMSDNSFYLVGSYENGFQYEQGITREITATGAGNPYRDMTYERYIRNSSHLLMGNLEMNFNRNKLSFNSLYIHTGSSYTADMFGRDTETFQVAEDFGSEGLVRRYQINDNSIIATQIVWNGNLSERVKYNIGASLNHIIGKEPDRRMFRFPSIGNGMVELAVAESRNQRFNSEITETSINPTINIQYRLSSDSENISFLEVGYSSRIGNRKFSAPFYNHVWNPLSAVPSFNLDNIVLDPFFNQEGLSGNSFRLEYYNDTYEVLKQMHGAYIDLVYQIADRVTLNAGLRGDYIFNNIRYEVNRGASIGSDTINRFLISPSFNIRYIHNEKNHIRLGSSRTFTLPQDKEISPFIYLGFDGNDNGNPDLEISTNYNFDIKWDYYISTSEILSLNGFYKYILKPIARVDQGNSAGLKTFDNVSDYAVAAGVEAELRKRIFSIASRHNFVIGINASYIYSRIKLDPVWFVQNTTSTLEGAAPYIVNADITYNMTSGNFSITSALVVNYVSDKVHTIGTRGYNNLIEESTTTLDFVNSVRINNHISIGLKAKNLLNPEYRLTRKGSDDDLNIPGVVIRKYQKGVLYD
ncbi:MAG: carboxypeptidase-like regulatory domain-containing protein, partial [Bacteroidales bacterium]|nr:carboxypeptidase-like regulatory domain-containing protein [Bacteroidales bacterium]